MVAGWSRDDALGARTLRVSGTGVAADYCQALLEAWGARVVRGPGAPLPHPSLEWARSGAMALTGPAQGPPRLAPAPLASCARGAVEALRLLAPGNRGGDLDGPALLGERAAILGLTRRGGIAPGGSCRLLPARDGWVAVNLARPDDVGLLPAWLGEGDRSDPWAFVAQRIAGKVAEEVVERARLLGIPAALAARPPASPPPWFRIAAQGARAARPRRRAPLVVDLSSLWAGPLCAHLLGLAGARVLKVESGDRPDGARFGPAAFFDLLNAGKRSAALDFGSRCGRDQLRRLLESADIVLESARPRALAQLGIDAQELVGSVPGLVWVSITGYGRREPGAHWVAFGDDAGVAAGLARATAGDEAPIFCGDAIADPLTGVHAAVAALAAWRGGGGRLVDLALRDVVGHVLGFAAGGEPARVERRGGGFEVVAGSGRQRVLGPSARRRAARARPLGADTEMVLAGAAGAC